MEEGLTVLFVEDDPAVRLGCVQALQLAGLTVESFGTAEQAVRRLRPGFPGVLVTDVKLPGMDGVALLGKALETDAALPVILVTGHGDISMAVQAMRLGAYDFIEKPFSSEELTEVVRRAMEKRALTLEVQALRDKLSGTPPIESRIIGHSPKMERLRQLVVALAATDADVLIRGETGTGKELVARCLHDHGRGKRGNFAALNCGGIPETLFESEVFGHESGSFTGAMRRRIGKIEYAQRGTLFLDEIETMPMSLQIKMLRILQERQFERLGSNQLLPMHCRVVAASKADLLAQSEAGAFRADLYYRLSVAVLDIPPLRERREDIPLLFSHFLLQAAMRYERQVPNVSTTYLHELMSRPWPGNVRELGNVADRLVLELDGEKLSRALDGAAAPRSLDEQVMVFERYLIEEALKTAGGRISTVCALLSVPKNTLYDKMRRLGIQSQVFRIAS